MENDKRPPIEQVYLVQTDLKEMTDDLLMEYILGTLLPYEDERLKGAANNTAEHKLLFLVGGPENDTSVAYTHKGVKVTLGSSDHPKAPEITEATAAISDHFERERNMPHVLSEISDILYNLVILTERDQEAELSYRRSINALTAALDMSLRDALLITAVKYKMRMENGKNVTEEDSAIEKLIQKQGKKPSIIKEPHDNNLTAAYRAINVIGEGVIKQRLASIASMDRLDSGVWDTN